MHIFRPVDYTPATLLGHGTRVLLASSNAALADRLARLGGKTDVEEEVYAAVSALHDDPQGWGLFVIDADGIGGLDAGRKIGALAHAVRPLLPVIIISSEVCGQVFPEDPAEPVLLRAPVSAISLRVGFEHALRDRLLAVA